MSRFLLVLRDRIGYFLALGLVAALMLGTAGYLALGTDFLDSLYNALSLFVFSYAEPPAAVDGAPQEPNLAVQIARFLAPLTTITAGVSAVLFGLSQASDLAIARRLRNHTVICNPTVGGRDLAADLRAAGEEVVVVCGTGDELAADLRLTGIPVVEGDPANVEVLKDAGVAHAKRLIALPARSSVNFGIASALRSLEPRHGRQEVSLFSDDPETVDYLTSKTLPRHLERLRQRNARSSARAHARGSMRTVEWNSIQRMAALAMLSEFLPISRLVDSSATELLVVGRSELADAFILELGKQWWGSRDVKARSVEWSPLPVTLVAQGASAWRDGLVSSFPGIERALRFEEGRESVRDLSEIQNDWREGRDFVAFILDPEPVEMIASLAQFEALRTFPVRVVVGTGGLGIQILAELGMDGTTGSSRSQLEVSGFDLSRRLYTQPMLSNSLVEQLANLNHLEYLKDGHIVGRPADRPWEALDERDRESNRKAAIHHLGYKLDALGVSLLPLGSHFSSEKAPEFSREQVEQMAIAEHDRWLQEKLAEGWTSNPALENQDREKREHPDMVPWEELSEETKNQDRIFVRALPGMLRACGFELVAARGRGDSKDLDVVHPTE